MKVLTVCGIKASGKTTVCTGIIEELCKRGYTVGSLKDIHFESFHMDIEGSNSDRHKKAGAMPVIARGKHETDIMYNTCLPIDSLISFFKQDYVILEGVYEAECPKILTAHSINELDERITDRVFLISGRIADNLTSYHNLPALSIITHLEEIVDLIEKQVPDYNPESLASLYHNGVRLPLSMATARELMTLLGTENSIRLELKK